MNSDKIKLLKATQLEEDILKKKKKKRKRKAQVSQDSYKQAELSQ